MALIDNCEAYYKVDETSGTNLNDEVVNRDGTASAAAILSGSFSGIINTCGRFGVVDTHNIDLPSLNIRSISFWAKFLSGGGSYFLDGRTTLANSWAHAADVLGSNWTGFYADGVSKGTAAWTGFWGNAANKDRWVHVVLTSNAAASGSLTIGARYSNEDSLEGYLDEIGVWSRLLDATDVDTIYDYGIAGLSYPFVGDITITPNALTLSTTATEPVYSIQITGGAETLNLTLNSISLSIVDEPSEENEGIAGTIGTRLIQTKYPYTSGLTARTTKQTGRRMSLVPQINKVVANY
jgi:hypothetical protein